MELSTDSGSVAMLAIGAIFAFLWFGFHYPSVWIGVIGILLIIGGVLTTARK